MKNFGRSGRTKYTHLVDQDTTQFESPWISETSMTAKFHATKGGGMKQIFERPSVKKRKATANWNDRMFVDFKKWKATANWNDRTFVDFKKRKATANWNDRTFVDSGRLTAS